MIRLLDWCTLTWKAKKQNWQRFEDLHNALPVNVSSAIVIAAGFLTSTSLTDVLSINTGSGDVAITIGMPWTLLDALMLPAGAPVSMRQFQLRKARELSPLPFLIQLLIAESCPHPKHCCTGSMCAVIKPTQLHQLPPISVALTPGPVYGTSSLQGI